MKEDTVLFIVGAIIFALLFWTFYPSIAGRDKLTHPCLPGVEDVYPNGERVSSCDPIFIPPKR